MSDVFTWGEPPYQFEFTRRKQGGKMTYGWQARCKYHPFSASTRSTAVNKKLLPCVREYPGRGPDEEKLVINALKRWCLSCHMVPPTPGSRESHMNPDHFPRGITDEDAAPNQEAALEMQLRLLLSR